MTDSPGDVYEVGPFGVLGLAFRVRTDSRVTAGYLHRLFRHLAPPAEGDLKRVYRLKQSTGSVPALVRAIDEDVIAHSPRLLLHAAGGTHEGVGLALPARTGGGKSTLIAGLVQAGFNYLTDEFISPDWETGEVQPYPRAISLDPGVWEELADLEPTVPPELESMLAGQWQIDPEDIRPGTVAGPCRIGQVLFPRYEPGASASLRPLSRAQALIDLIECTFHFHEHRARAFDVLARLVADCMCYQLIYSNLDDACTAICRMLGVAIDAEKR